MTRRGVITGLLALGAWACGDGAGPDAPSGSMAVALTGAVTDTLRITGSVVEITAGPATFATARYGIVDTTALVIVGFRGRGVLQDLVQLDLFDYAGAGDYAASGEVVYGDSRPTGAGKFFTIISGALHVVGVSGGRARGTFDAVAATAPDSVTGRADTVRLVNGTFDVPILRID